MAGLEDIIKDFLDKFYQTISFGKNEGFKSAEFKDLFYEKALLIENRDGDIITKSIDDHIGEFETAIESYPEVFVNGFMEEQTGYEILSSDMYILVKSDYIKKYTINGELKSGSGSNMITLVKNGNKIRIFSIAW